MINHILKKDPTQKINQFNYKVDNSLSYNLIKIILYNQSLKLNLIWLDSITG